MTKRMVTLDFLKEKSACSSGTQAFQRTFGDSAELFDVVNRCIESADFENLKYANWLVVRFMTKRQKVIRSIYAAKLVLYIYENEYPDNPAPRNAIKAAEAYLKRPCERTKRAAYAAAVAAAAAYAAYAAAHAAAAADAAYAAAYAAAVAAAAAYAAHAAHAAAAAYAADNASARIKIMTDILQNDMRILSERRAS